MEYTTFNDTKFRFFSVFSVLLPVGLTTEVWIKSVAATSNITDVLMSKFHLENLKHNIQISLKNHIIDTNSLANMYILTPHVSGFRMMGNLSRHQFDPGKTPIPWTN